MRKVSKVAIGMMLLVGVTQAGAACFSETGVELGLSGIDDANGTIFVTSKIPRECGCSAIRFQQAYADTNKILEVALEALLITKANSTGTVQKVRIDYQVDPTVYGQTGCNSAFRMYLE